MDTLQRRSVLIDSTTALPDWTCGTSSDVAERRRMSRGPGRPMRALPLARTSPPRRRDRGGTFAALSMIGTLPANLSGLLVVVR
jgi:hypothetical protein